MIPPDDKITQILNSLSKSSKSLRKIVTEHGYNDNDYFDLCGILTSDKWIETYARARFLSYEHMGMELTDLADSATPLTANQVRLQVDTRKWILSKLLPKKYGDKLDISGQITIAPEIEHLDRLTVEELTQLQALKRKALGITEPDSRALPAQTGELSTYQQKELND